MLIFGLKLVQLIFQPQESVVREELALKKNVYATNAN
jgi:hypothetical protein